MLNDTQLSPALTNCDRCKGEIYNEREAEPDDGGHVYCSVCRGELERESVRADIALEVLEVADAIMKEYLSKDLSDAAYNKMARKLRVS